MDLIVCLERLGIPDFATRGLTIAVILQGQNVALNRSIKGLFMLKMAAILLFFEQQYEQN